MKRAEHMHVIGGPTYQELAEDARRVVTALLEALRDGICAHKFDSMVCVATAGHDGPHITSNERFPHGLQFPSFAPAARPLASSLTVERLAEWCREIAHGPGQYDWTSFAEQLLPRLAGPAQEGPQ